MMMVQGASVSAQFALSVSGVQIVYNWIRQSVIILQSQLHCDCRLCASEGDSDVYEEVTRSF